MLVSNTPDTLRLAQALQAMVKDGGFDLKIEPVEYSSLLDEQDRGNFEILQLGWCGRIDPDANITNFVGTGGSQNVAGYKQPGRWTPCSSKARQASTTTSASSCTARRWPCSSRTTRSSTSTGSAT